MVEILLACYITIAPFVPVGGWEIVKITNKEASAEVTLRKQAKHGDSVIIPSGCVTTEPKSTYGSLMLAPNFMPGVMR